MIISVVRVENKVSQDKFSGSSKQAWTRGWLQGCGASEYSVAQER